VSKKFNRYVCNNCGYVSSAWSGRCPNCNEWNSLVEDLLVTTLEATAAKGKPITGQSVKASLSTDQNQRLKSHITDIDEVLGGGIVAGSVNLIAGQPGIGKSTLLLQLADAIAGSFRVLYVSAEESAHQVSLRAHRLKSLGNKLQIATSTSADDITATIASKQFDLIIIDSIQAISCQAVSAATGSISQIVNAASMLSQAAKLSNTAIIIVGHVTKEGSIAGPKVLEHSVDVVLELSGDRYGGFKLLRAVKNRFGSTSEAGIFEMSEAGLMPVDNPSAALLAERRDSDGSIVLATLEGTRPLLVEVQALVNKSSYGYPKRAASGFSISRLNLLVAMLEKRTKLSLADQDIYINIVGGIDVSDPAADLAVCLAIGSAAKGLKLGVKAAVFGEIGLAGEVRRVPFVEKRLKEAKKLGFNICIGPSYAKAMTGLKSVEDVRSALNQYLEKA
jgi:DNA repair protein RadA/Sms